MNKMSNFKKKEKNLLTFCLIWVYTNEVDREQNSSPVNKMGS